MIPGLPAFSALARDGLMAFRPAWVPDDIDIERPCGAQPYDVDFRSHRRQRGRP